MGIEFEEGGVVLRILYATLGKRPTKILVVIAALAIVAACARWLMESIEWFVAKIGWQIFTWGTVLEALFSAIIATMLMLAFFASAGLLIGFILSLTINKVERRKVEHSAKLLTDILQRVKPIIPEYEADNIQSLITQTQLIGKVPLYVQILNMLFGKKGKKK